MVRFQARQWIMVILSIALCCSIPFLYFVFKPETAIIPTDIDTKHLVFSLNEVEIIDMFADGYYNLKIGTYDMVEKEVIYLLYPSQLEGFAKRSYCERSDLEFQIESKVAYFTYEIRIYITLFNINTSKIDIEQLVLSFIIEDIPTFNPIVLWFGKIGGELKVSFILYEI